jgi:putative endopeptidase
MSTLKSGLALEHSDPTIRIQDDLFRHMNGKWLKESEIPADRAVDGAFNALRVKAEKEVFDIIEELSKHDHPAGSNAQKIGDMYRSFMDEDRIEKLGIAPLVDELTAASSLKTSDDFISLLGDFETRGNGGLFYSFITSDHKDSHTNIAYIGQSGISLPDEAYYREDEYAPLRAALVMHIEKMFDLAGLADGAEHARRVLALETKIAAHHWDQVRDRDSLATYNKFSLAELAKLSEGFNWDLYLQASKMPRKVVESVIVRQPSFFSGLGQLLAEFDAPAWSSWLQWHLLSGSAPFLNKALVEENFAFFGTTLSGTPELRERWKRGVSMVEGVLGEAIGEIYVAKHFPPAAKARMEELVHNLLEAYRVDIAALDWMTSETKKKAFEKIDKFTPKIGYPDKFRDYSALTISADDLIGNIAATTKFQMDYEFAKIGAPVDRSEWHMFPQTVNAYYNPGMNEIVFPAGILQAPFFDLEADDAANYGGIGAVIGHEVGHGFDDQGSKYDGDGNLVDWWQESDRVEFDKRAQKLIDQYEVLYPVDTPDVHVNGALTVGENIGDLGGLTIALKAYEIALKGASAPVLDGFTGVQRLFLGWAQVWRGKGRIEELKRRLATDPHSPSEFRCNQIVKNLDEFYQAFDVKEGDALYLAPEQRVRIW